jgi:hypothetical protein
LGPSAREVATSKKAPISQRSMVVGDRIDDLS